MWGYFAGAQPPEERMKGGSVPGSCLQLCWKAGQEDRQAACLVTPGLLLTVLGKTEKGSSKEAETSLVHLAWHVMP